MLDFTRLESLAKIKGVSKTHLCSLVGRPKYYLNDIKNKGIQAADDYIAIWADALNTTPEYLKGETDQKEKPASTTADGLTPAGKELLQFIESLPPEKQKLALKIIKPLSE